MKCLNSGAPCGGAGFGAWRGGAPNSASSADVPGPAEVALDGDGDLVVRRRPRPADGDAGAAPRLQPGTGA